jgi:kinase
MTTPCYLLLLVFLPCLLCRVTRDRRQMRCSCCSASRAHGGDPPVLAAWNTSAAGADCKWPYVQCDVAGRISSLFLASNNISGPFPDAVGSLFGLTHLDISNNYITDTFPTSLYRCGSLHYLDLS